MRAAIVLLGLALFAANAANAQTTYVLVDRSSSISKTEGNAAKTFVEEHLKPLAEDASVSLTYFGGNNGGDCKAPVKITDAVAKSKLATEQPPASASTPIFAALQAAFPLAAANSGEIFLVTDGREGCGVNLCAAVKRLRATYPKVPITFRTLGEEQRDLDAHDELGCVAAITSADIFGGTVTIPPVEPPKPPVPPNAFERWYWLFDFLLFAGAAVLFSFHFGHRSVLLEQMIQGRKEGKAGADPTNADAAPSSATVPPAGSESTSSVPLPVEEQLKSAEGKALWKRWAGWLLMAALVLLILLLFVEVEFFQKARDASWSVLNSEFANAFAVLELSVIGLAGLEFWRYTQLKREYAVISGELRRQAIAEEQRRKDVLYEAYGRQRKSVQRGTFSTPWDWRFGAEDRDNLKTVLEGLLGLAINPEKTAENVTDASVSELRRYSPVFGGWDVQKFADRLQEDERISETVFRNIEAFFDLLRLRQPDRAKEVLAKLAAVFRPPAANDEPTAQTEGSDGD
jgi:hypothetical protein